MIWEIMSNVVDFIGSIDERNEDMTKVVRKISRLLSKFIMDSRNEKLLNDLDLTISKAINC